MKTGLTELLKTEYPLIQTLSCEFHTGAARLKQKVGKPRRVVHVTHRKSACG